MKISKLKLMLLAGAIWCIAGINVLIVGIRSYENGVSIYELACSLLILCLFWFFVFKKGIKHSQKIKAMKVYFS